jgi:hypothetical protein
MIVANWVIAAKAKAFRVLLTSAALLFLSVALPVAAFHGLLRPDFETYASWFQRSGALMVFFAVWAEFRLQSISGLVDPNGYVVAEFRAFEPYKPWWSIFRISGLVLALIGTFIWGYGDLFFRHA